jgi:hypothetical protein
MDAPLGSSVVDRRLAREAVEQVEQPLAPRVDQIAGNAFLEAGNRRQSLLIV